MNPSDLTVELQELSAAVTGTTLLFAAPDVSVPGAQRAAFGPPAPGVEAAESPDGTLREYCDGGVDVVLGHFALERCQDPAAVLRVWRRVLREGGRLVLVLRAAAAPRAGDQRQSFTPGYLVSLLNAVGGFQVMALEELWPGRSYVLRAERLAVAEVRMPLGSVAPAVAEKARLLPAAKAELCFQVGVMMLQSDEPALAEQCFRRTLASERSDPETIFALGMSQFGQGRHGEALVEVERALAMRPDDRELQRWAVVLRRTVAAPAGAV